jgi:hypothetical protein
MIYFITMRLPIYFEYANSIGFAASVFTPASRLRRGLHLETLKV